MRVQIKSVQRLIMEIVKQYIKNRKSPNLVIINVLLFANKILTNLGVRSRTVHVLSLHWIDYKGKEHFLNGFFWKGYVIK